MHAGLHWASQAIAVRKPRRDVQWRRSQWSHGALCSVGTCL